MLPRVETRGLITHRLALWVIDTYKRVTQTACCLFSRGGPRNSSRGGGVWAGILQGGGGGRVQVRGNYTDKQNKKSNL